MFVLIDLINLLFEIYSYILIASIVMSWLLAFGIISYGNANVRQFIGVLNKLTEPVLGPIRRILPAIGGLDFSPLVAFIILRFVQSEVIKILVRAFYSGG